MVKFTSTTNPSFEYLEGTTVPNNLFKIDVSVWFDDFHTSYVKNIKFKYSKDKTVLTYVVDTRNSRYVFTRT